MAETATQQRSREELRRAFEAMKGEEYVPPRPHRQGRLRQPTNQYRRYTDPDDLLGPCQGRWPEPCRSAWPRSRFAWCAGCRDER